MKTGLALLTVVFLAGCMGPVAPVSRPDPVVDAQARAAVDRFVTVVQAVEPVAEAECRARAPRLNCDYRVVVDDRVDQPPNAYQTVDRSGRPVIAFTVALIADVRNADELALIMGHEAAHHIRGHLARQQANAGAGAMIFAGMAAAMGATPSEIRTMSDIGATVGVRSYSKAYEIEADRLGAQITQRAGFDPVNGAGYFTRVPDPGNVFLGTHPPNADRITAIRRAVNR